MQKISKTPPTISNLSISIPVCPQSSPVFYSNHSKYSSSTSSSSISSNDFDWPETFGVSSLLDRMDCPYEILDTIFPELKTGRTKRGELRKLKQKTFDVIREVNECLSTHASNGYGNGKSYKIANEILTNVTELQRKVKRIIKNASLHRKLNEHQPSLNT
jgi:hypothetical protein